MSRWVRRVMSRFQDVLIVAISSLGCGALSGRHLWPVRIPRALPGAVILWPVGPPNARRSNSLPPNCRLTTGISPNGAQYGSPGQRPGRQQRPKGTGALKGRNRPHPPSHHFVRPTRPEGHPCLSQCISGKFHSFVADRMTAQGRPVANRRSAGALEAGHGQRQWPQMQGTGISLV